MGYIELDKPLYHHVFKEDQTYFKISNRRNAAEISALWYVISCYLAMRTHSGMTLGVF